MARLGSSLATLTRLLRTFSRRLELVLNIPHHTNGFFSFFLLVVGAGNKSTESVFILILLFLPRHLSIIFMTHHSKSESQTGFSADKKSSDSQYTNPYKVNFSITITETKARNVKLNSCN